MYFLKPSKDLGSLPYLEIEGVQYNKVELVALDVEQVEWEVLVHTQTVTRAWVSKNKNQALVIFGRLASLEALTILDLNQQGLTLKLS